MNPFSPLVLMLFSLFAADPKTPCEVKPIRTPDGAAHALICVLQEPLPTVDPAHIPPELAPLLSHSDDDAPPAAPEPQAAPKSDKDDDGHIDGGKNNRPHGPHGTELFHVSFGG